MENTKKRKIDPATTVIPFIVILALCTLFVIKPEGSTNVIGIIRGFLGDTLGLYYLIIGLGILLVSFWIAFSDIGKIRLGGKDEKPKYNFFTWGAMIFTCGLAADILFYSFVEWIYYSQESRVTNLGSIQEWASTMPLFHWGPIPWSFYAVLAACFGFMLHVRGCNKQKYSEACRPLLGDKTDKLPGKIIDVLAVIALIAGTATTFSVSMPLLSTAITKLFGFPESKWLTIAILVVICLAYTIAVITGMKGVSYMAKLCMWVFGALLVYVLIFGGKAFYILETGFSALGNMVQNFIGLSTYSDPLRENSFPQNWTIFYWAYWLVWCVASPFFMGSVSRGRTVKQVILGSYIFGMSSTLVSFIILGNFGLGMQLTGKVDVVSLYEQTGNLYEAAIEIIKTLPCYQIVLVLLIISMIAFYATSFDSITLVASAYSYKQIGNQEEASNRMKLFWAILLIMLPIALIFNESSMSNLQSVSIIAAFPIAIVIIMIIASFIKDAKRYIKNEKTKQ
ncbi:MAG: BCCT family transporter [Spirochaetales bacterium]|nr:BCCT family transporter [Spirochaetales bacterium]MDY5915465.1 BCCT family transporter [Treponema sp.]